jgi:hypothetical protein
MPNDTDICYALLIALAIIVVVAAVWGRVSSADLEGYWLAETPENARLFEVRPAGGRGFEVRQRGSAATTTGRTRRIRAVEIPGLKRVGSLELGGRRLVWRDGTVWTRQGVRPAA